MLVDYKNLTQLESKLLQLRYQADNIERVKRTHYKLTLGENVVDLYLDISSGLDVELDVYINDRGWHTGEDITPFIRKFMYDLEKDAYECKQRFYEDRLIKNKEFWNSL